jgi:hypothetical protein
MIREHVSSDHGREVDTASDSVPPVFETAKGATEAVVAIRAGLAENNAALPDARKKLFRIDVHLGVIIEKPD